MTLPDWVVAPQTILAFAVGITATLGLLYLSPGGRKRIRDLLGIEAAKAGAAAGRKRVRRFTLRLDYDAGQPAPQLFIRTLVPTREGDGGWETYQDMAVPPQAAPAPAAAGQRATCVFELNASEVVRWLLNQDQSLPFKPFLLVPEAAVPHFRNELCLNGHTVTGWGDAAGLPQGQRRIWFLFANGRPQGADEVQDLNHVL